MNPRHVPRLILVGLVVVVTLVLGAIFGWPVWLGILLPILLAGVLLLTVLWSASGAPSASEDDDIGAGIAASEAPPEDPYLEYPVNGVPVPSAVVEYPFLFSATIRWRLAAGGVPTVAHGNPPSVALASVLRRAQLTAGAEHPSRCEFLRHWLESTLGVPMTDESDLVTAYATDVRLTLRPADQKRLDELDAHRKSVVAWEGHRQHERNCRTYFGEDVLSTPGSAVVWWLSRHEDEIDRAVEMIGPLTCLSAAANDDDVPEEFRHLCIPPGASAPGEPGGGFGHPESAEGAGASGEARERARGGRQSAPGERVSALLDEMGFAEGSDERAVFVDRLARMSEKAGRPDVAQNMRRNLIGDPHHTHRTTKLRTHPPLKSRRQTHRTTYLPPSNPRNRTRCEVPPTAPATAVRKLPLAGGSRPRRIRIPTPARRVRRPTDPSPARGAPCDHTPRTFTKLKTNGSRPTAQDQRLTTSDSRPSGAQPHDTAGVEDPGQRHRAPRPVSHGRMAPPRTVRSRRGGGRPRAAVDADRARALGAPPERWGGCSARPPPRDGGPDDVTRLGPLPRRSHASYAVRADRLAPALVQRAHDERLGASAQRLGLLPRIRQVRRDLREHMCATRPEAHRTPAGQRRLFDVRGPVDGPR